MGTVIEVLLTAISGVVFVLSSGVLGKEKERQNKKLVYATGVVTIVLALTSIYGLPAFIRNTYYSLTTVLDRSAVTAKPKPILPPSKPSSGNFTNVVPKLAAPSARSSRSSLAQLKMATAALDRVGSRAYFDPANAEINPVAFKTVQEWAELLVTFGKLSCELSAHDTALTDEKNFKSAFGDILDGGSRVAAEAERSKLTFGMRRASAIKDLMVGLGVDGGRIFINVYSVTEEVKGDIGSRNTSGDQSVLIKLKRPGYDTSGQMQHELPAFKPPPDNTLSSPPQLPPPPPPNWSQPAPPPSDGVANPHGLY